MSHAAPQLDCFECSAEAQSRLGTLLQVAVRANVNRALAIVTEDVALELRHLMAFRRANDGVFLFRFALSGRHEYRCDKRTHRWEWSPCGGASASVGELLGLTLDAAVPAICVFESLLGDLSDQRRDLAAQHNLMEVLQSERAKRVLVFLETPQSIPELPGLSRPFFERLSVPLPGRSDLRRFAREELAATLASFVRTDLLLHTVDAMTDKVADALVGTTVTQSRNRLLDALDPLLTILEEGDVTACRDSDSLIPALETAVRTLVRLKSERLAEELSMCLLEGGEFPIGLDSLRAYLEINRSRVGVEGPDRLKGVLCVGPPGTGKTQFAKAVGGLLGVPTIDFRISSLMNQYLGATEQRFDRAFSCADALAPACLFLDEIEKTLAGQGAENDGGTMMRCKGRMLTWLSESVAPNFIVATANDLRHLGDVGAALTRSGRFDKSFYLGNPAFEARRQILRLYLGRSGADVDDPEGIAGAVAEQTRHFSGADLRAAVNEAAALARYARRRMTLDDLEDVVETFKPRARAVWEQFAPMREWARANCVPAGPCSDDEERRSGWR